MGIPPHDNGNPAMLQLRRWDLSQLPFDLSDYSEGFISPTRELLLLLSSHRDAMLLPLTGGCFDDIDAEDSRREDVQSSDSSPSSMLSTSGSLENPVSEPRSTASCGAYSGESSASISSSCRFISDVHSLAWGTYGDSNRHSKEATFREFLFVSGSHGVTVHAFRQLDEGSDEVSVSPAKVVGSDVRWVEWGPSGDPTNIELPGGFVNSGWIGEDRGMYGSGDDIRDGFSRKRKSVKWLRSVLTSVGNRKHEGALWTFFPENLSISCSAKVVSFHIFSNDSTFLGFIARGNSEIWERVGKGKVCKPVNGSCTAADRNIESFDTVGMSQGFQCLKLFSSNSGNLVGFVLALVNAASDADQRIGDRGLGKIILVSRLGVSGLQWLCSVKLDYEEVATVCEWADFQFSDNLLVCLNVSGTVSFYDALVGEYIACVNVLEIYGLKREPPLNERGHLSQIDTFKDEKGAPEIFPSESGDNVCRKDFQRLLISSDTSLLAVVDQHSAVYIICASDHVPQKYCSYQRFSSNIFRAGELFPWTVCDSDISCQRVIVENSFGNPNIGSKRISLVNDHKGYQLNAANCWYIQGKVHQNDSNWSRMVEIPQEATQRFRQSRFLRKILLPTTRASADNIMCFSQRGITRLSRKICTNDRKDLYISHTNLHIGATTQDDGFICSGLDVDSQHEREILIEEAVGCIFQGCFYLVTTSGLQVFLPSVSVSLDIHPIEAIAYPSAKKSPLTAYDAGELMKVKNRQQVLPPWKVEALDRVLLFEGPDVADHFCLENGLDQHACRLRRLQVALGYMILDAVERSLEELANIDMAEEGMLRLILAAVFLMADKGGNENEVSSASRLLAVASHFATKMVRKYAILAHEMNGLEVKMEMTESYELPLFPSTKLDHKAYTRRLHEMSRLLVVTRNLQCRLASKFRRPVKGSVYDVELSESQESSRAMHDSVLSLDASNSSLTEKLNIIEVDSDKSDMSYVTSEKLVLNASESVDVVNLSNSDVKGTAIVARSVPRRQILQAENPRETIERWKVDNMDLKNVVEEALLSGRLPLAVLQLHLHRSKQSVNDSDPNDTFNEVRSVGRAIAYDLFLKGETGLAMTTLQKLGEDVETCLRQLLFGTVNRLLKKQITEEMKKYGYLRSYELALLDRISLIERIYPSSNFWRTYNWRRRQFGDLKSIDSLVRSSLRLLHPHSLRNLIIECGEVDGVVLGSWTHLNGTPLSSEEEDPSDAGYWASAAVWSNAWDQNTFDRVLLDQPFVMGIHVMWESQLEYYLCHNDWEEVSKLLEMIPSSMTPVHSIHIVLDGLRPSTYGGYLDYPDYGGYVCSPEELDAVYIDIPNLHIFQSSVDTISSTWMRMLIDKELAKKFIFLKEYWDGTKEILSLMARSGYIFEKNKKVFQRDSHYSLDLDFIDLDRDFQQDTVQGFHKLVIHHCSQYNLPFLMDLYLDQHKLALDDESLNLLLDSAGDCEWAKWLLMSRVKGHEYDASFSNARTIMSRGSGPANISHVEANDIIQTVDDIAENGMLMASLATMMFAPLPLQSCLSSGIVGRSFGSSAQCSLENLRPALLGFPTLWRMLVSVCLGNDTTYELWGPKLRTVVGSSALSVYLHWRDSIFYSSGHDSSLLQMLPCWFPRQLRRLIQLYVQGPIGCQSTGDLSVGDVYMQRDIGYVIDNGQYSEISALSWEAAIQKQIQQELFAASPEETGLGLEHHLLRGHPLAAMNYLLGCRVQRLKSENSGGVQSSAPSRAPLNIQMDVQTLFAPLTHTEESLLSVVHPLAISNYQNSMLVASCTFLLELCGLSAARLRVDTAALRRISYFYKFDKKTGLQKQVSSEDTMQPHCSEDGATADSLARALADNYMQHDISSINTQEGSRDVSLKHLSHALLHVLHHLEKASLPELADGMTYGSWLLSGDGDGSNIRSQQKAASQQWNLVTAFCQMHQIPISTKYLALLARDNDWVGFLSEAQIGGYPFETVIHVAMREFKDARLQTHILSVLRAMQSKKKATVSPSNDVEDKNNTFIPIQGLGGHIELFGILAECEKQKHTGKVLLHKAKRLQWSMLAIIASCFPDASPLHCLTVWLEITAMRDASTVKAEDITSQIANSVGAAVEAANSLPASDRVANVKYNRRRVKRQRLLDSFSVNSASLSSDYISAQVAMEGMKNNKFKEAEEELYDSDQWPVSLPKMLSELCEQQQFLPLLRGFEMFIPSCSLLSFIRALQAFSQMRLSEASAHLGSFSARIKEEPLLLISSSGLDGLVEASWISSTAKKAADAVLSNCPSPYEKRCLLQLLASTDFSDGGSLATYYRQQYWKINLAEPSLRKNENLQLGDETLDDASLLTALVKNGHWEQARNWARQLEASGGPWKFAVHHVTESQAESMVAEWKEFLWDVAEERVALWGHCQTLFIRYAFPALQAGLFFLKHAEAIEKDLPAEELHAMLLLSLQWLSGMISQSNPVCPMHLLREIETRVWLLAVKSEAPVKSEREINVSGSSQDQMRVKNSSIIDQTATLITKMDAHINRSKNGTLEKTDVKENSSHVWDDGTSIGTGGLKPKRRAKAHGYAKRSIVGTADKITDLEECSSPPGNLRSELLDENLGSEISFSKWEERIGPAELERAVLSLLEFGQITASKQLQHKLSPDNIPLEFKLIDAALALAELATLSHSVSVSLLNDNIQSVLQSYNLMMGDDGDGDGDGDGNGNGDDGDGDDIDDDNFDAFQVLQNLSAVVPEGNGHGLCKRIIAVVKAANVLEISFSEAFEKKPTELLQLLSLKAQDSFEEARLLVQTHSMPTTAVAQILAESFLKGLLAAHRGGYIDSQKEEGPAPLLWRFSDFLKWAELCPSESEVGHALMRLVITGQEIPPACEVELLILSHHFYKSSACLDGVDVLVALAATRVDAYVSEGDFSCLARLVTGVGNFHALNFIISILIENGQLDLLLQKYSSATTAHAATVEAGFRMAILTALQRFNPNDLDAFAMVYNHFDMKHESAALLLSRAARSARMWLGFKHKNYTGYLLESMRYYIEAAEVFSSIDAGEKTRSSCAQASLVSLQIRMPDITWLDLPDTQARRALANQYQFQEALILAEAYNLNHPAEWVPVLWERMLKPEPIDYFVAEFVAVLPLHASMLLELARFYKNEVLARRDQSQFSVWLAGGLPADWAKHLERAFRCLINRTRDLRLRMQLAVQASGFSDVIDACNKEMDKVPENAGPLVLRKGHGGAYLPLM